MSGIWTVEQVAFSKLDGKTEPMDCTVTALSVAANVEYSEVYEHMTAMGRNPGRPCP
jgi:hypothetical protein